MTGGRLVLDSKFWREEFAVTDGDLNRLYAYLSATEQPVTISDLLQKVIKSKWAEQDVLMVDRAEQDRSAQAAQDYLDGATLYHPSRNDFRPGEVLLVIRYDRTIRDAPRVFVHRATVKGFPEPGRVEVILEWTGESVTYVAGVSPDEAQKFRGIPLTAPVSPDEVIASFAHLLIPKLLGRLRQDKRFMELGQKWFVRDALPPLDEECLVYAEHALRNAPAGLTTEELLSNLPPDFKNDERALFTLHVALVSKRAQFINVGTPESPCWVLSTSRAREILSQQHKPQTIQWLITTTFNLLWNEAQKHGHLVEQFESLLHSDDTFLFDNEAKDWVVIPVGLEQNNPAYHVLWETRRPLTEKDIEESCRARFSDRVLALNLEYDKRFKRWGDGKWGLSPWVSINDQASEYLNEVGMPLLATTITDKVCQRWSINPRLAIFTPEDDARFVRQKYDKLACRRLLTSAEIEQMLRLLGESPSGLPLDVLVATTLEANANCTDAAERLASDQRFICLDGVWFSRETAFYRLTDADLARFYQRLQNEQTAISLVVLIREELGRDCRLTDATDQLREDDRFREIRHGFWATRDFVFVPTQRKPAISPRVTAEEQAVTGMESPISVPEQLTKRRGLQAVEAQEQDLHQVTLTLGLLDVQCGSLRVGGKLNHLLSPNAQTLQLIDEQGYSFLAFFEKTGSLLQGLHGWFTRRKLTYGDKITFRATDGPDALLILPAGKRDERVYQEALQRQDTAALIESARRTNKRYNDLMIEVMEYFGTTLHREEIYLLVDYNRTASRNYIFALLSLPDCPYEELRYFVSHGGGYWAFDRRRKEAFDMRMKELEERLLNLESENARLQQRLHRQRAHIDTLEHERSEESAELARLRFVKDRESAVAQLSARNVDLETENRGLQASLQAQMRRTQELEAREQALQTEIAHTKSELEAVVAEAEKLRNSQAEQQGNVKHLLEENNGLCQQNASLVQQIEQLTVASEELQRQVTSLAGENEGLRTAWYEQTCKSNEFEAKNKSLQDVIAQLGIQTGAQQTEWEEERQGWRRTIAAIQQEQAQLSQKVADLQAGAGSLRSALRTPLGRIFVQMSRWLRQAPLSDI